MKVLITGCDMNRAFQVKEFCESLYGDTTEFDVDGAIYSVVSMETKHAGLELENHVNELSYMYPHYDVIMGYSEYAVPISTEGYITTEDIKTTELQGHYLLDVMGWHYDIIHDDLDTPVISRCVLATSKDVYRAHNVVVGVPLVYDDRGNERKIKNLSDMFYTTVPLEDMMQTTIRSAMIKMLGDSNA